MHQRKPTRQKVLRGSGSLDALFIAKNVRKRGIRKAWGGDSI